MRVKLTFFFFLLLLFIFGCNSTEWQDTTPKEFQGVYYEVSEPVIQGLEEPIVIKISEREFQYTGVDDEQNNILPILRVSKRGSHIVIFCGDNNEKHIADFRYQMFWGKDNYLHISEIVDTGYNDEEREFEVGKFTKNQYFKR